MRSREEKQHKKGQETNIGKIIYGFLLFMPLISIAVTCCYVIFNKNAYQSYSGTEENEYTTLTSMEQVETNKEYHFSSIPTYDNTSNVSSGLTEYTNIQNIDTSNFTLRQYLENGRYFVYYARVDSRQLYVYDIDNNFIGSQSVMYNTCEFDFTLLSYTTTFNQTLKSISLYEQQSFSYIDNVFYYSVDKVTESSLFNWAENSIIYTTTANTCTALSITTPFIPLLFSYWLIISVMYFLYDIALMLVWLIHNKIHSLQESL